MKNTFLNIQDIHYSRQMPSLFYKLTFGLVECFYKIIINSKNFLYEIKFLKIYKPDTKVICVGNLTTGGVGKTPIVINLANKISKTRKTAIISKGYKSKISSKKPIVVKDFNSIKFSDGTLCGDEPFQIAKKTGKNVAVIICKNRKAAIEYAIIKFGIDVVILDDGFSDRKIQKDDTILVIDSKMKFGNNHLLPFGPLREPVKEIKRANEIILVNKGDENIKEAISWVKKFNLPVKLCEMEPSRIYNSQTKADIIFFDKAIAFSAIGQNEQFFDFAKRFYKLKKTISFEDHHEYTKSDIDNLIKIAKENDVNTFITTQKDETKLKNLIKDITKYSFNILELSELFKDVN